MEYNELLTTITQTIIIPLLIALVGYAVKWINAKANEIKANTDNAYVQKYVEMLRETITTNVIAVNQTYVDALKEQNAFTKEAQEEAFRRVYEAVMTSLTEEAYLYLETIIGDLQDYITAEIEATVKEYKLVKE